MNDWIPYATAAHARTVYTFTLTTSKDRMPHLLSKLKQDAYDNGATVHSKPAFPLGKLLSIEITYTTDRTDGRFILEADGTIGFRATADPGSRELPRGAGTELPSVAADD